MNMRKPAIKILVDYALVESEDALIDKAFDILFGAATEDRLKIVTHIPTAVVRH